MATVFVLEDELHAEPQGEFADRRSALAELERLAALPWDESPNRAPCSSWATCGRSYHIIELEKADGVLREVTRYRVLDISPQRVQWSAAGCERLMSLPMSP